MGVAQALCGGGIAPLFGQDAFVDQPLEVARVAHMQQRGGHGIPGLVAVYAHFGAQRQHCFGHGNRFREDGCGALLGGEVQTGFPRYAGQRLGHVGGEGGGFVGAVGDAEHGHSGAEAGEAHAVPALAFDLDPLRLERQAGEFHDVVEHARENAHDIRESVEVETRFRGERGAHAPG